MLVQLDSVHLIKTTSPVSTEETTISAVPLMVTAPFTSSAAEEEVTVENTNKPPDSTVRAPVSAAMVYVVALLPETSHVAVL